MNAKDVVRMHSMAQAIIDHNGLYVQVLKLSEEMSELNKELMKYVTSDEDASIDAIREEAADVKVCLTELELMFNLELESIMISKLERQIKRIEEERNAVINASEMNDEIEEIEIPQEVLDDLANALGYEEVIK